ncbi:LCP family protein [Nostocoides jenkinsii]|uniref:Cell envelope-related transcriptional attenuator n=1 Tax=Nostocoides jenkinsii Ben 74 TaxID=1193518 RepID=A0A077MFL8_9MICO|nr:LCP family protein [Tetrasphaera jenkinsii]CCI54057.1 Cell envelope-related transcriptional attenuator [Tetrasphaera jenkinsii Ben 74]
MARPGLREPLPVGGDGRVIQRPALRRALGLTLLSTVIPGAGLLWTRHRRAGIALLLLVAATFGYIVFRVLSNGLVGTALSVGVSTSALRLLMFGVIIAAVVWCAAILATAFSARPHPSTRDDRLATTLLALLCCMAIIAPSAWGVRTLGLQKSLVTTVFHDNGTAPGGTSTAAVPAVGEDDPWKDIPRVNVLLIGSDAGADRVGVRPDSMMVASINSRTGDTVLIGVPRNLENAPFPASNPLHELYPDGYNCGDACLINGVWTLATDRPDLFPGETNPGLRTTRDVVGETLGLSIDHTVVIDLSGFAALVNAMGGVTINVKERVCIGCKATASGEIVGTTGYIDPGVQHLDGYHALWYARSRAMSDDFSRMRRQRCVVGALVDQVSPTNMLMRYPELAKVLKEHVSIDIGQQQLPAWVPLIERIQRDGTVRSLPLTNKVIDVGRPDFAKIRELVANATSDNPTTTSSSAGSSTSASTTPSSSSTAPSESPTPEDGLTTLAAAC